MSGLDCLHGELVSVSASYRETVLWLIRHPEPEQSAQGICYGSLDVQLSPAGMQQAERIAQVLASQCFDAIYSSPSQRCMYAASQIAAGRCCGVQPVSELRELDFGSFEGLSYDEIAALHPGIYHSWMESCTETQFPSGENFSQLSERVMGITRTLVARHEGGHIAFVTHGGPIRVIVADVLGMPMQNIFRIGQHFGAINCIRYSEQFAQIELINFAADHFA